MFEKILRFFRGYAEETPKVKPPITNDPLLRKVRLEQKKAQKLASLKSKTTRGANEPSFIEDITSDVVASGRGVHRSVETLLVFVDKAAFILGPLGKWLSYFYARVYNRFAFRLDESGERSIFSRHRSAATVFGLALFTLFLAYQVVWNLVPATARFSYDAVAINLFSYEESLVFSKPDWVVGEPGVLSVFACRKYPCVGQDDSIEFRLRDSIYLDVVRTLTRFEPHDPGELAGAFLSEENQCTFRAYGVRMKYLGFYPYIVDATCSPL